MPCLSTSPAACSSSEGSYQPRLPRRSRTALVSKARRAGSSGGSAAPGASWTTGVEVRVGLLVGPLTEGGGRWLEGALVLKEGAEVVGAVFVAPEGIRHEAVVAFAAPRRDIGWLTPVALEVTGEPPTSLELGGIVMQRKRRLFVEIERLGRGAPVVRGGAVFAEYEATGRAMGIVLVLGASAVHAWHGARYEPAEYDHWGRGS